MLAPFQAGARMKPRISVITLGVADLPRALAFYRDGLGWPTDGIVGSVAEHSAVVFFDLQPGFKLALFPRASIAVDAGVAEQATSSSECILSHNVARREQVTAVMAAAEAAGARIPRRARDTAWGGHAGYFQDPDGHLWEVAWNPKWPLEDG
jgi:catechol 2,3-dioxygenase-like lactoylglutathione lyase family enzyme